MRSVNGCPIMYPIIEVMNVRAKAAYKKGISLFDI